MDYESNGKSERRERAGKRARYGMGVSGRSLLTAVAPKAATSGLKKRKKKKRK